MRSLKNLDDIEKIKAVLFKVGAAFSFVPFKPHGIYVHILCLQSRPIFFLLFPSDLSNFF